MLLILVLLGMFVVLLVCICFEWMRLLALGLALLVALACIG